MAHFAVSPRTDADPVVRYACGDGLRFDVGNRDVTLSGAPALSHTFDAGAEVSCAACMAARPWRV